MELIDKYNELYDIMAMSKDVDKMHIFGNADRWAFENIAKSSPEFAKKWLAKLEAVKWCNYLSEAESNEIISNLENQDGKKGGKWSAPQIEEFVNNNKLKSENAPYWNFWSLVAVMDMIYSDHAYSLSDLLTEEQLPIVIYHMAIEKLEDVDRKRFVRPYFGL